MKSPFPGMDPYLEPHWLDVRTVLIGEARRALNRVLPPGLVARAEEQVAVESDDRRLYARGPDVRVLSPSSADQEEGGIAIEAPFELVIDLDPVIERFLRVFDESGQLLTVIDYARTDRPLAAQDAAWAEQLLRSAGRVIVTGRACGDGYNLS